MNLKKVPLWGIASSAVPPVVLAVGWTIGASVQSRPYDPLADTVSALAGIGATDRWMMTLAFVVAGVCEVATGLALRPALRGGAGDPDGRGSRRRPGRGLPGAHGRRCPGSAHPVGAVIGLAALAVWPLGASRSGPDVPRLLRPEVAVPMTVLLVAMLALFGIELVISAGQAGLTERVLGEAQAAWPFAVTMSCHHPVGVKERLRLLHGYRFTGG